MICIPIGSDEIVKIGERSPPERLKGLGKLPREHGFALSAKNLHHVPESVQDPVRRLVKHKGRRLSGQFKQAIAPVTGPGGKKSLKQETIGGEAYKRYRVYEKEL